MCHPYQYRELKPPNPSILTYKSEFVGTIAIVPYGLWCGWHQYRRGRDDCHRSLLFCPKISIFLGSFLLYHHTTIFYLDSGDLRVYYVCI